MSNNTNHLPLVALAGMPNSGKTSLFNLLTKSHQRVANYPGITVEKKSGTVYQGDLPRFDIIDLPGIYTLDVTTLDEKVTKDCLFGKSQYAQPHLVVLVLNAINLKRSLYLAKQLKSLRWPMVIALNMFDSSNKRGQKIDLDTLSTELGCPVVPTSAVESMGREELIQTVIDHLPKNNFHPAIPDKFQTEIKRPEYIKDIFASIDQLSKKIVLTPLAPDTLTKKIDKIVLHPLWGPLTLIAVLLLIFQTLFSWADPMVGVIESSVQFLATIVESTLPNGALKSLLVDGVINGVGGIIVFLPHIALLFLFILILEDSGYLGRAAFLMNTLMRKLGLPGKAVIPLLSSHACAIPGIMGARIIENPKERLTTMMVAPLTTCSARLPVYTMLIGALIPNQKIGFLGLQGLTLFALYMLAMMSVFVMAFIFRRRWVNNEPHRFLMDLPPYRLPDIRSVLKGISYRSMLFLKKAGTVILTASIILWALITYPKAPQDATLPEIHYSAAANIGKTIQPLFAPLGFDWRLTTALIPSFAAREIMVSSLATVMSVEERVGEDIEETMANRLKLHFPVESLLALLIWFVYAPQCISTYAVLKKETNGHKWPVIMMSYTLALAYVFAWITRMLAGLYF